MTGAACAGSAQTMSPTSKSSRGPRRTRTPLDQIAQALAIADREGRHAAARHAGVHVATVGKWVRLRERHSPQWPTPDDIAAWHAAETRNAPSAAAHRAWLLHRMQNGGNPLFIDATGTARRLQALSRLGWSCTILAAELGISGARLTVLRTAGYQRVHINTARRVSALYDRLSASTGPSPWTRASAVTAGWLPPLAWDNIDDPLEVPAVGELRTERGAHARRTAFLEDVLWLADSGLTITGIAERMHTTAKAVERRLYRMGEVRLLRRILEYDTPAPVPYQPRGAVA